MRIPKRPKSLMSHDSDTMTPMIDVVFLLLVFFICASVGGTVDHVLPADLEGNSADVSAEPQPEQSDRWEHPDITIQLQPGDPEPKVILDRQALSGIEELQQRLQRLADADPESRVILQIDDDVQIQEFITVYDLCQSLKLSRISFAVQSSAGAE
jgi:biopolymer transport protein ExbD